MNKKNRDTILKITPIVGWIYIVIGIIFPFENLFFFVIWIIDVLLCVGLHALQLFVSIPIAKKKNISAYKAIIMTMIFGATWWKPLKD
ncbi:MAG: hypothetical protein A2176_00520 [Spirochaetes bacterium RBG_13_51_14]|nr:MAG: hypothetical protein A2176_00520 [Spirochaetes bacterium RBG_13_51_14]